MATKATWTRMLVNQWDFSGVSNSLETSVNVVREDVTTFQSTAKQFVAIGPEGSIAQQGYVTAGNANTFEYELTDAINDTDALYVAALYGTDVAKCAAYVARATNADGMSIKAASDKVLTLSGSWGEGVGIARGLRMFSGTISATGGQTYIDMGAAGGAGGLAWLFIQAITGTATNATITVQSDDNTGFATPATEGTFTFSAVGGQEIALSGAVDRYVRLNATSLGGATNYTVVGVIALSGITY